MYANLKVHNEDKGIDASVIPSYLLLPNIYSWFYSDNLERCPLPTVGPIVERPMLSLYRLMECFIPQCALTQNRNRPIDHPWFLRSDSVHLQIPNTKFYWKTCQLKRRSVKPQLIKTMSLYFFNKTNKLQQRNSLKHKSHHFTQWNGITTKPKRILRNKLVTWNFSNWSSQQKIFPDHYCDYSTNLYP